MSSTTGPRLAGPFKRHISSCVRAMADGAGERLPETAYESVLDEIRDAGNICDKHPVRRSRWVCELAGQVKLVLYGGRRTCGVMDGADVRSLKSRHKVIKKCC